MVRLLKVVAPVMVCVLLVPFSVTVLLFLIKVPLLDQLPETARVLEPSIVSEAPDPRVRSWQTPSVFPMMGWFPPALMTTLVVEVGIPPHQLEALFQSVSVVPIQVPVVLIVTVTSSRDELSQLLVVWLA